jgi:hypothetical protein
MPGKRGQSASAKVGDRSALIDQMPQLNLPDNDNAKCMKYSAQQQLHLIRECCELFLSRSLRKQNSPRQTDCVTPRFISIASWGFIFIALNSGGPN